MPLGRRGDHVESLYSDRFLPDKAIDLMDKPRQAAYRDRNSMPTELDEVNRRHMQLEIEREALKKEKDAARCDRLAKIEKGTGRPEGAARRP